MSELVVGFDLRILVMTLRSVLTRRTRTSLQVREGPGTCPKHDLLPFVRKKVGDFLYPYGAFPDDDFEQHEGYESEYQTPTGEDDPTGERYRIEALVSAEKLVPLFLDLCQLLPARVFVSLERSSADMYSRWDEFVSDEVDREEFLEIFRGYQFAFAEDGNLGIGAFAQDPPIEVFLGSHKEVVVFSPDRKPVLELLRKHGVEPRELDLYYRRDHTHLALTDYRGLRGPQFDFLHVADVVRHALGMVDGLDENFDEAANLGLGAWPRGDRRATRFAAASAGSRNAGSNAVGLHAGVRLTPPAGGCRDLIEKRLRRTASP